MTLIEMKDFNALIDNKLKEMSRNDDFTTRNLSMYLYHQNYYKVIGIDLSRQKKL